MLQTEMRISAVLPSICGNSISRFLPVYERQNIFCLGTEWIKGFFWSVLKLKFARFQFWLQHQKNNNCLDFVSGVFFYFFLKYFFIKSCIPNSCGRSTIFWLRWLDRRYLPPFLMKRSHACYSAFCFICVIHFQDFFCF